MEAGDKIRVKQSARNNQGEIGTILHVAIDGIATIKSPSSDRKFYVHTDFLEEYDWDDE
jgi:hypothetical protein